MASQHCFKILIYCQYRCLYIILCDLEGLADLRIYNSILNPVYKVVYICIDGGQSFNMAGHNALDYKLPFI